VYGKALAMVGTTNNGRSSVRTRESLEIAMVWSKITDVMIRYPAPLFREVLKF